MFYVLKTRSNSKQILIVKRECIQEKTISIGSNVTCYFGETIDELPNPDNIYSILKAADEPKIGHYIPMIVLSEHENIEAAQESIKTRNLKRSTLMDTNESTKKAKSPEPEIHNLQNNNFTEIRKFERNNFLKFADIFHNFSYFSEIFGCFSDETYNNPTTSVVRFPKTKNGIENFAALKRSLSILPKQDDTCANCEVYKKVIDDKDNEIAFLRNLVRCKENSGLEKSAEEQISAVIQKVIKFFFIFFRTN